VKDTNSHLNIILERYADRENIGITVTEPQVVVDRYLSKVMAVEELRDKIILEIGAGCSQYAQIFLDNGCVKYYANDLIPERLAANKISDPRCVEIPGDFRAIEIPEPVDLVFANLTMMFVMPMLDEFVAKIHSALKVGGTFVSMDPNYLCPLAIYRRFADTKANPSRLFNPFSFARTFREHGFIVERLVPFTPPLPFTTGIWPLGTCFWLRARKEEE
jgi:SAM-dependent methyltransferase